MPESAPTTAPAGSPASSSSSPTSHSKSVKILAASQSSSKTPPIKSSADSAIKKPVLPKAVAPSALQRGRGPVALKPNTRNPAPQNALSPAVVTVASTSQRSSLPLSPQQPADVMTMSAVISPAPSQDAPVMSMTSKEWVIPPRPKPGRKPATDTPPTKRKAQNRAAQRAFRERRAARVGELEEQLEQQKSESDQRDATYKDTIRDLELEVQSFRSRCLLLENMLERERKERLQAETALETMRRQAETRPAMRSNLPEPSYQPSYAAAPQQQQHSQHHQHNQHQSRRNSADSSRQASNTLPPLTNASSSAAPTQGYFDTDASLTCGNCEPSGRCACVEEVLNSGCGNCDSGGSCKCTEEADALLNSGSILKRSASPIGIASSQKRARHSPDANSPVEVDFTNMFQGRGAVETSQPSQFDASSSISGPPSLDNTFLKDNCGFCKDGTYCVCADTAMATPAMTPVDTLPPIASQTQTPPPSEADVGSTPFIMEMTAEGAVKLPRRNKKKPIPQAASRGCGSGGPGTCDQCRADPKSGLFCRLMAANFTKGEGGGCCGGKGADGGCCKSKPSSAAATPAKEKITLPSLPSLGLSCAEAYQTLASHRNFERAADDIGSWLPKLKTTTPAGRAAAAAKGSRMGPIEVEAASIMSVLKDFDVRFGRDA